MIKLVISDIDGTLFCNEKALWKIENGIARDLGFAGVSRKKHRLHWYKPTKERLAQTYPGADAEVFFRRLTEGLPAFMEKRLVNAISERNVAALQVLKEKGKRLAIVSARDDDNIKCLLQGKYGLAKWFEKIYHCGNLEYAKPDPRVFERALVEFGVEPKEAVYIGDLETDGICAKEAGLHFVAVLEEGIRTKDDFKKIGVDFFADTFPDILDFIVRSGNR